MKISKFIMLGMLALGMTTMAQAQTVIHYTGSTAYRGQTHNAILHAMTSGSYGYVGTSFSGASQAIFVGTINGTSVIIKTSWSGSEAGIQAVSQQTGGSITGVAVNFLPNTITSATLLDKSTGGAQNLTDTLVSELPDVAMSDTAQTTSQFSPSASIVISGTARTYATLVDAISHGSTRDIVGIVPFKWVASNNGAYSTSGTITNISTQQARALYSVSKVGSGGGLPLSVLTGNNADSSFWVYPTGRNPDSGTRLTAFAETGIGATKAVTQYQPTGGASAGSTVTAIALWPVDTVNSISVVKANSGFSSGGTLAKALGSYTNTMTAPKGTGGILISYLSTGDAATALTSPGVGKELTYNGVLYSTAAVQEGAYTFWGYEHMYYPTGYTNSTIVDTVAAQLYSTDAAVLPSSMNVSRSSDGGTVTHN